MPEYTPLDERLAQSWALVWRNVLGLALCLALIVGVTGIAGSVLDLLDDTPRLSVAGRAIGIAGGTVAIVAGLLAVKAYRVRSRRGMLAAYGTLVLAGALFGLRAL